MFGDSTHYLFDNCNFSLLLESFFYLSDTLHLALMSNFVLGSGNDNSFMK